MNDIPPKADLTRRSFLSQLGVSAAGVLLTPAGAIRAVAGPFADPLPGVFPIPGDKKFSAEWLASLTARGAHLIARKSAGEIWNIGMPIGGIGCGQLYLGGDGALWHWDIFNLPPASDYSSTAGVHYANPPRRSSPLEQGFAIRVEQAGKMQTRALDASGWSEIEFRGRYPIADVTYTDPQSPVSVALEAFSPFIPLNADESSLPATILAFTIKNESAERVKIELAGWLQNVVVPSRPNDERIRRVNRVELPKSPAMLHCRAELVEAPPPPTSARSVIIFEDFESGTYDSWTITGTAFGDSPMPRERLPGYMGGINEQGRYVVNTHQVRGGEDVVKADEHIGTLLSREFTIERDYIRFRIGGGNHPGQACINLLIDGTPVLTETGRSSNRMRFESWDVKSLAGKTARIQIVDGYRGGWGQIGVDEIVFSDIKSLDDFVLEAQPDYGTLALAMVGAAHIAGHERIAAGMLPAGAFEPFVAAAEQKPAAQPIGSLIAGAELAPNESRTITFVLAWHFAKPDVGRLGFLRDIQTLRRHYAARFADAAAVAEYVTTNLKTLSDATRLWVETWYDSTLPLWFLDRTMSTASTLATATVMRFDNGRFYGWEGTHCCAGTCTHVWQYAQAVGRLFPELERDTRQRVDFGLEFDEKTGLIHYRGEAARELAIDGQAGTILRAWREHTMCGDDALLKAIYPRVRQATELLIARDTDEDGILDGPQYNTCDATWHGQIAWLSSLYCAALRAAAAMAVECGDAEFAARCNAIAERGGQNLVGRLFNGEYFYQRADPAKRDANATGDGCHADQLLGQAWALQAGLPRVVPLSESQKALQAIYRYNFAPDVGPYRLQFDRVNRGGRWYAMPGEGGMLMCTWPRGGIESSRGTGGEGWAAMYFNECWTGYEHQVAAHMIWEGLVQEGLAIERMIHDRYRPSLRNPYNEIECSDHYARAMASYGVFLAACGYEHHGPRGFLAFSPKLTPERFRAAFTAAGAWGTFEQTRESGVQSETIAVKYGSLALRELAFDLPAGARVKRIRFTVNGSEAAHSFVQTGERIRITLADESRIAAGGSVAVGIE